MSYIGSCALYGFCIWVLSHLMSNICSPFCRLNSGPVRDFSRDVGNRTTIRMSYPEGSPKIWEDVDPQLQFVAVIYKAVDFNWLHAMLSGTTIVSSLRSCVNVFTFSCEGNENAFLITPLSGLLLVSPHLSAQDSPGPQHDSKQMLLHIFHVFITIYSFFTTFINS